MLFIGKVQSWYGQEILKCVLTAFILRHLSTHHDCWRSENVVNVQ